MSNLDYLEQVMFLFAHTVLEAEVCRVKLTFDGEN
jgi:hypothetical protein